MRYYTIYEITNLVNGKTYIGKHETDDPYDDYLGSGKNIRRAIEKYGIDSFHKHILFIFNNEMDMNAKEKELVTEEFVLLNSNYNLCPGGHGGFGYINSNNLCVRYGKTGFNKEGFQTRPEVIEGRSKGGSVTKDQKIGIFAPGSRASFQDKKHTIETKIIMSSNRKGLCLGNRNAKSKSLLDLDGVVYDSITEYSKLNNKSEYLIKKMIKAGELIYNMDSKFIRR